MTNWRILISAPYAMPVIDWYRDRLRLENCETVVADVRARLEEDDLLRWVQDVDGMICGDDRITDRVLAAAPRLKVISKWGTGIDSIDAAACARRGIALRNTPNAFSEPVADTVLGYMLLFARQLVSMDGEIRNGRWQKPQLFSLREKTLGIIGVGNCGRAVVRRAIAFGMRVLGTDPVTPPQEFLAATGLIMTSRDELLRQSDFVTLHADLNASSHYLINDATLALMKPDSHLINAARGPIVEEAALVRALAAGRIAGAALDVFEFEPLPRESHLRQFPNCYLAPHNANSSRLAADRVHENTIRNLLDSLREASPSCATAAKV